MNYFIVVTLTPGQLDTEVVATYGPYDHLVASRCKFTELAEAASRLNQRSTAYPTRAPMLRLVDYRKYSVTTVAVEPGHLYITCSILNGSLFAVESAADLAAANIKVEVRNIISKASSGSATYRVIQLSSAAVARCSAVAGELYED